MKLIILALALTALQARATLPRPGEPGAPADPRYCGEPERNADGSIKRSPAALYAFKLVFPCPTTLKPGACPRFQVNHTLPLADGGCDTPVNMMWLPLEVKTCVAKWCVDRWERVYHAIPRRKVVL